jgi:hypothetical protein
MAALGTHDEEIIEVLTSNPLQASEVRNGLVLNAFDREVGSHAPSLATERILRSDQLADGPSHEAEHSDSDPASGDRPLNLMAFPMTNTPSTTAPPKADPPGTTPLELDLGDFGQPPTQGRSLDGPDGIGTL